MIPMRLSVSKMKSACKNAYLAVRGDHWKIPQAEQYLRTCNIRDSRIKIVVNQATTDRDNDTESEPEVYCPQQYGSAWTFLQDPSC